MGRVSKSSIRRRIVEDEDTYLICNIPSVSSLLLGDEDDGQGDVQG